MKAEQKGAEGAIKAVRRGGEGGERMKLVRQRNMAGGRREMGEARRRPGGCSRRTTVDREMWWAGWAGK